MSTVFLARCFVAHKGLKLAVYKGLKYMSHEWSECVNSGQSVSDQMFRGTQRVKTSSIQGVKIHVSRVERVCRQWLVCFRPD